MDDERVWLRHKDHGGFFHCPIGAVEDWTSADLGWELTDEVPEEPNPVTAELLAWQAEQRAAREADEPKTNKRRTGGTDTTPQEG
jgi:hypothetical protein